MCKYKYVKDYLNKVQKEGKSHFTLNELDKHLVSDKASISRSLTRLTAKRVIVPIKNGFYIILSPIEQNRGISDPKGFIDPLMSTYGKPYYVSLLTAAAWQGAAHQAPMTFYVTTTYPSIRHIKKKNIHIHFSFTTQFPKNGIIQSKTNKGYINTSSVELTILDLIKYEKSVGHLERVSEVIIELIDAVNVNKLFLLLPHFSVRVIQRLGYILEDIIEEQEIHKTLYQYLAQKRLSYIPLQPNHYDVVLRKNKKWKININEEINPEV